MRAVSSIFSWMCAAALLTGGCAGRIEAGATLQIDEGDSKNGANEVATGTGTLPDDQALTQLPSRADGGTLADGGVSGGNREDAAAPIVSVGPIDGPVGTWVDISPARNINRNTVGLGFSPAAPNTLYVDSYPTWPPSGASSGIYKSTDGGNSWKGPIGTKFFNNDGTPYTGKNPWLEGVSWNIAVDPLNADVLYAMCAFWGPQGMWKSTDGGDTWRALMSDSERQQMSADLYSIQIDPRDHLHLLVTFHSGWSFGTHAGVAESKDGGKTWLQHPPQGAWAAGHYVFFLGQDDSGAPSSDTWLLATQSNGYWRTLDGGRTWSQVSAEFNMQHGAGGMYRASSGVLYTGATNHLIRSTDNGKTWSDAKAPFNPDGYNAVIGDGVRLYVQSANTGKNTTGPQPFYTSLETDGTHWTAQNEQLFDNGPGWMAVDRTRKVIFSANWDKLWRLKTGN